MKTYLKFFLIFSLLELLSGYLIGQRIVTDKRLHTYTVKQKHGEKDFPGYLWGIGAKKGTRVDQVLDINLDKLPGVEEGIKITRIIATDSSKDGSDNAKADLAVIDGMLGKRSIRLKFTSQRGYGFKYSVRVYGIDFGNLSRRLFNRWKDAIENTHYKDLVRNVRYKDYQSSSEALDSDRIYGQGKVRQ